MTLFIADDEKNIRDNLKVAFEKEQFTVYTFANGSELLNSLKTTLPDLCILDIMMPKLDGIETIKKIREAHIDIPVMFLTSKDDEFDRVSGLNLGADDYLCKPFSLLELIARVRVILKRYNSSAFPSQTTASKKSALISGDISLDSETFSVTVGGNPLSLTVTEFRLLEAFMLHPNAVLSRDQLMDFAYPDDTYQNDRAIDCHMRRLRKKIGFEKIETIYGMGYKFVGNK